MFFRALISCALLAAAAQAAEPMRLPTGVTLDPIAPSHRAGSLPLNAVLSPDGKQIVLLLCGWREEGVQVIDRASGEVVQTLAQPAAFVGLAFSPDGSSLWASGGDDDAVYRYAWHDGRASLAARIELLHKEKPKDDGKEYPAGLAFSRDGKHLFVAQNLGDGLIVIDTATNAIVQRLNADRYPYAVVSDAHGNVYVSCWGDNVIDVFRSEKENKTTAGGMPALPGRLLLPALRIEAVRHPSALALSADDAHLFVASATTDTIGVIETKSRKLMHRISDAPPAGPREGSTPNALLLSRDGKRLFVAEADNNAVAVIDISTKRMIGRMPVEWYPTALARSGDELIVVNAKGKGTAADRGRTQPDEKLQQGTRDYTLGQLDASVMTIPASPSADALHAMTARVAKANGWDAKTSAAKYPPFKHVIYILKENRTYDQVFGDMTEGDGDPSLLFFGPDCSPNHHALAKRFGLFDRFFVNAEVSAQGHNWSTAAYSSDYVEKTTPTVYASHGRHYDYEGSNRNHEVTDEDDVASPSTGYIWDLAARKGVWFRNYGNFITPTPPWRALKRALARSTNLDYPSFDLDIMDQKRFEIWVKDFNEWVSKKSMPALQFIWLPNDHTAGRDPKKPTPRAYMADNDLALGHLIETLSKSMFWRDTVVFVLEDDAQSGPDHFDSHRSPFLVISAYNRGGVNHTWANTTDALATMEEILGLGQLSKFDHYARPLRGIFAPTPDLTPYQALVPTVDMNEKNPETTKQSSLDLTRADANDDDEFNRILWSAIKGDDVPYPGAHRTAMGSVVK